MSKKLSDLDIRRAERQAKIEDIGRAERQAHEFEKLKLRVTLDLSATINDLVDTLKELIKKFPPNKPIQGREKEVVNERQRNH